MGKFPISAIIFSFLVVITAFVCLNFQNNINTEDNRKKSPDIFINYDKSDEESVDDAESMPASTTIPKTQKYILKFDGSKVILTCYENGKENSSPIPDINIDYLTEIDRKHLFDGIELERKEDVFKLIEDFSS